MTWEEYYLFERLLEEEKQQLHEQDLDYMQRTGQAWPQRYTRFRLDLYNIVKDVSRDERLAQIARTNYIQRNVYRAYCHSLVILTESCGGVLVRGLLFLGRSEDPNSVQDSRNDVQDGRPDHQVE